MKSAAISSHALSQPRRRPSTSVKETSPRLGSPDAAAENRQAPVVHLTPRQLEVLSLLCEGLPNKLICRRLNIAPGTVKVHISSILKALGVTSRLQAMVAARRRGILGQVVAGTPEKAAGFSPEGQSTIAAGCSAYGTLHPRAVVF